MFKEEKMKKHNVSRRQFLMGLSAAAAGGFAAGCTVAVPTATVAAPEAAKEEAPEAAPPPQAEEELYGMVVFLKGSEFFNWAYKGMVDAAARIGPHVKTELQGPAEWDASLEARAIDELVAKGATGILATAGDATAMDSSINAAVEGGVPVILFDSDAPASNRLTFASTNQYQAGYEAGKAMADWGVKRVVISTFIGPDHLQKRVDGFTDALTEFAPDAEIVQVVNDEGKVEVAEAQLTAALEADPTIDGIFGAHGNPGPGAAAAVRTTGLEGQVQIMAFDFGLPVIELIDKGEIKATVGQNPYLMGYTGMLLLYGSVVPTDVPSTNQPLGHVVNSDIDTGVAILTKDDIEIFKTPPSF
jgi:ribose transport system substrate-binding protein